MSPAEPTAFPPLAGSDAVLDALPHPVIMVSAEGRIAHANAAAEAFFERSLVHLRRNALEELVPFGSPLLPLVEQVRSRGAAVNEYKVDLGTLPITSSSCCKSVPSPTRWIGSSHTGARRAR